MIDLAGVARHLRLPVDSIRRAADMLEQGYHPAFISQYRADETGSLPSNILWTIKLEIDRQQRLEAAKSKALASLPKDAEEDKEAIEQVAKSVTAVEVEAAMRAMRARRQLNQSQQRDSEVGKILEALIAYSGPPLESVEDWVAEQLGLDAETTQQSMQQVSRLVQSLVLCDTELQTQIREYIKRKAEIRVESCEESPESPAHTAAKTKASSSTPKAEQTAAAQTKAVESAEASESSAEEPASSENAATVTDAAVAAATPAGDAPSDKTPAQVVSDSVATTPDAETEQPEKIKEAPVENTASTTADDVAAETAETGAVQNTEASGSTTETPAVDGEDGAKQDAAKQDAAAEEAHTDENGDESSEETGGGKSKKKSAAKMTPRQRPRRWLISMLQPMRSLKKPIGKLSAYQHLMLGRGRRSQLIQTPLKYDSRPIVRMVRDTFVDEKHPLAKWFSSVAEQALRAPVIQKVEADAIADIEEQAQDRLLETATDQLRAVLSRRPVRGHTIMLVDTVGPKTSSVIIVDQHGRILGKDELACSAQPSAINQNVIKLGELAHKHRVTLLALTNGPARRYLVLSIRELMKQSADSGLRWTMADRGGAEAYAASRSALKELSTHNRRDRAAIWIARSLQDPLQELLKVDINRLRLGSYQRELPQEPLKKLIRETLADCVCARGLDVYEASADDLQAVPGVAPKQAEKIVAKAQDGGFANRKELVDSIPDWNEQDARQAIPWLRLYGSDQPLDATTVHPEDYRLAQRLLDNTELETPPTAPEGWEKPSSTSDDAAVEKPEVTEENSESAAAEAGEATETAQASPESAAESSSEAKVEQAVESPESAESSAAATEAAPEVNQATDEATSSEAEATPDSAVATEATAGTTGESDASNDSNAAEASTTTTDQDPDAPPRFAPAEGDPKAAASESSLPELPSIEPEYPEQITPVSDTIPNLDVEKLARGWQVGREKLKSIALRLHEPFADPRLSGPPVPLLTELPTMENLKPGTCLWAVVVGVADFGAFVELSPDCSGLIHISRLSANYIEDPHQSVQVGDLLMAWVISIDEKKGRVALTVLSPEQRAAAEAEAAASRSSNDSRRGRGGGGRGSQGSGGHGTGNQSRAAAGGVRQDRGGSGGRDRGQGGGSRPDNRGQGGGRGRGNRGRDGDRGRGRGGSDHSRTVVVTSKKPKAEITSAMKEGEEPLRSFSDLMQFYDAKRTDEPAAASVAKPASEVKTEVANEDTKESSPPASTAPVEAKPEQEAAPDPATAGAEDAASGTGSDRAETATTAVEDSSDSKQS